MPRRAYRPERNEPNADEALSAMVSATSAAPLPYTMQAVLKENGEPITLLQTGDVAAHSPSFLVVDETGGAFWVSFQDVQITDHRVIPKELPPIQTRRTR